jgi:hypothetical protein
MYKSNARSSIGGNGGGDNVEREESKVLFTFTYKRRTISMYRGDVETLNIGRAGGQLYNAQWWTTSESILFLFPSKSKRQDHRFRTDEGDEIKSMFS